MIRPLARRWQAIRADRRGVTIIEFALVLPVMLIILLATLDLGYRQYAKSVLQGVLQAAARRATIGDQTSAQIDAYVTAQLKNFGDGNPPVIVKKSYSDFRNVQQLEKITQDTAPFGTYNAGYVRPNGTIVNGDCYEDVNNDWKRDDMGVDGLGQADSIVYYQVTINFKSIVPMTILGWGSAESVTGSTVLRNQPYSASTTPSPEVRCYEK